MSHDAFGDLIGREVRELLRESESAASHHAVLSLSMSVIQRVRGSRARLRPCVPLHGDLISALENTDA